MNREDTDEMMMMITSSSIGHNNQSNEASTCITWKVYEKPFYSSFHQQPPFCDLTSVMDSELDIAPTQIIDFQDELQHQLRARKKAESLNKKLAKELAELKRGREALERVCEKLAREISKGKADIDKMKRDFEEERKMLRMAEVIREERVQMKMAEAKILFHEKLLELEKIKRAQPTTFMADSDNRSTNIKIKSSTSLTQRKASPEAENQHIKRGIIGFAEFPRVVRAMRSKTRPWGSKQECQKAQLRILLKQKNPITSNSLIIS